MPKYKCHKEVYALKIAKIDVSEGGATITPEGDGRGPFGVDHDYLIRHQPETGGYYVVYADGYKSYSPAEAFEAGYTLIE